MSLVFLTNQRYASSLIRGRQIAERLNVPCDPPNISLSDSVVLVKAWVEGIEKVNCLWLDVIDSVWPLQFAQKYPHVNIIAITELAKEYITARLENKVVVIPQHHCNLEGAVRDRENVCVVGYVGSRYNLDLDIDELSKRLKEIDLDFVYLFLEDTSISRKDVCDFYKQIDIQLTFRKHKMVGDMPPELKNPLKLENAGSFKLPTVGYPELNYEYEMKDCFVSAKNLDEVVDGCYALKNDSRMYQMFSELSYVKAQDYHIDKIIELYKELTVFQEKGSWV